MRDLDGWWDSESKDSRRKAGFDAIVMPYRWYTGRLNRLRPKTYDFIRTNALLPEPSELFEGQKDLLENAKKK